MASWKRNAGHYINDVAQKSEHLAHLNRPNTI
jgi:hypothetical protein